MSKSPSGLPRQVPAIDFRVQHSDSRSQFMTENLNVEIHGQTVANQYSKEPSSCNMQPVDTGRTGIWEGNYESPNLNQSLTDKLTNMINLYETTPRTLPESEVTRCYCHTRGLDHNIVPVSLDVSSANVSLAHPSNTEETQDFPQMSAKGVEMATVDSLIYSFSQSIKTVFAGLSSQFQERHSQCLEEEKYAKTQEMQRLEHEVAELQEEVINHRSMSTSKDRTIESLRQALAHEIADRQTDERNTEVVKNRLVDLHYKNRLLRKCLCAMRNSITITWKQRCEAACTKRTEELCRQYDETTTKLKSQIEQLQQEKLALEHKKQEYETAVQEALMRGLCCLNMEALKVLNRKLEMPSPRNFSETRTTEVKKLHHLHQSGAGEVIREESPRTEVISGIRK